MSLENFDIPAFTQRVKGATQGAVKLLKNQGFDLLKILQTLEENSDDIDAWAMGYEGIPMRVVEAVFGEMGTPLTTSMRDSYVRGRREGAEDRQGGSVSPEPAPRSADEDEITEAFFEESEDEVPVREGRLFPELIEVPEGIEADALKENLEDFSNAVAEFVESPLWENRDVSVDFDPDTGEVSRFEQWKHPDGFKFVRLIASAPLESPEEISWEATGDIGNGLTGVHGTFSFPFEEGPSSSEDEEEFENAQEGAAEEIERLLRAVRLAPASAAELTTSQETYLEERMDEAFDMWEDEQLEERMDEAFDERATTREEELETGNALLIGKHLLNDVMAELRKLPAPYARWKADREVLVDNVVKIRFTPLDVDNPHRQTFTYTIDGVEGAVLFSGGYEALLYRLDEIDDWPSYAKETVRDGYDSLQALGSIRTQVVFGNEEKIPGTTGGFSDVTDQFKEQESAEERDAATLDVPADILLNALRSHLFDASQEGPYSEEVGEAILSAEVEGDGDRATFVFTVANVETQLGAFQKPKPNIAWNVYGSGDDVKASVAFFRHTQQSEFDDALAKLAANLITWISTYLDIEEPEFVEDEEEEAPDLPLNESEKEDLFEDTDDPTPEDFEEEIEMVATDVAEGDKEEALSLAEDVVAAITVHQQKASEAFTDVLVTYPFITPEGAEVANEVAAGLLENWEYFPVEEVPSTVYKSRMPASYRLRFESGRGMVLLWTVYNYSSPQHVIADGNIGNFEILSRVEASALECPKKRISVASPDNVYLQKKPKIESGPSHIVAYLDLTSALRALYGASQYLEDADVAEACRTLLDRRTTPLYSEGVSTRYTLNPETGNLFEFPYFAK